MSSPSATSLHYVLFETESNLEDIKLFLENDSSSVNEVNSSGNTPLLQELKVGKHPIEIVKLLLDYGANVNCVGDRGFTPLQSAILGRNMDYISLFLENGADVNVDLPYGINIICFSFWYGYGNHSKDMIRLLLDAGCLRSVCQEHGSVLHCVLDGKKRHENVMKDGILQLLIEKKADVNAVNKSGRSVMCWCLSNDNCTNNLEILLAAGAVLNCELHTNPLLCATCSETKLQTDVIQFLLDRGASMNLHVLQCALGNCISDIKVIEFLLEHLKDVDIKSVDGSNNTLLHMAVSNYYAKPDVLKLLIKQGIPVDGVNRYGQTALHEALKHEYHSKVVKTLLESGSNVNALTASFETPLHVAMQHTTNGRDIFKLLFAYGARIGGDGDSFLKSVIEKYDLSLKNYSDCWKVLLKGYLLQFSANDFHQNLIQGRRDNKTLLNFVTDCEHELTTMASQIVAEGRTLKEFVTGKALFQEGHGIISESAFFNQLLRVTAENDFPMFLDNISAKIGRPSMEIKLQKLQLYAVKYCDKSSVRERVVLNYDVLFNIAKFLTDENLFRFIIASYNTIDPSFSGESSKAETCKSKTRSKHSEECRKHP